MFVLKDELPKSSGIYKITNLKNGHVYIGQSINIFNRIMYHHKIEYKNINSRCYNTRLYQALRKYGLENFEVSVLELCDSDELDEKEIQYISSYDSFKHGYNMTPGGQYWTETIHSSKTEEKRKLTREKNQSLKGENHPRAKLSNNEVINIRQRYINGESIKDIYIDYKDLYDINTFRRIVLGNTYKEVGNIPLKQDIRYTNSKLCKEQVIAIRKSYWEDCTTVASLSEQYGISKGMINDVVKGRTYSHIKDNCKNNRERKRYRLTPEQVKEIRKKAASGNHSITELSEEYHFSKAVL